MSGPMFKQPVYRSEAWKSAVRTIENCVMCGHHGTEVAHRNEGKGISFKTDDCLTAALCHHCHAQIDNGKHMTREERRDFLDRAILMTVVQLARRGLIEPTRG